MPIVEFSTPARLHFGMFSFGQLSSRRFGGVGTMVKQPGVRLRVSPSERFAATGPLAERVVRTVERLVAAGWFESPPPCHIEVVAAPQPHTGLGSGTQLALAVARSLLTFHDRPPPGTDALARATGRGLRSAVGLHGFEHGGLLLEAGKLADDEISPLVARVALCDRWRFVLACPLDEHGLSGEAELRAFEHLPPVPQTLTDELCRVALLEMFPAATARDCPAFGHALDRFGTLAGTCFKSAQGGVFCSPRVARLADSLRACGAAGVAQTSWGPTLAAVVDSDTAANALVERIRAWQATAAGDPSRLDITITAPDNHGARWTVE
jgi:beta-RFAP synthase